MKPLSGIHVLLILASFAVLNFTSVSAQAQPPPAADEKVFMCYWGTWSVYRTEGYFFNQSHIDVNMCTHLIYSFVGLNKFTGRIGSLDIELDYMDGYCEYDEQNYRRCGERGLINATMNLKKQNPNLKVLAAVGGWSQGSLRFSEMAANDTLRNAFVESVISFINMHGFDGLDVDWEYPATCADDCGRPEDYVNFPSLLKQLRTAMDNSQTGGRKLYLTAAVAAGINTIVQAYNISEISKHLDYINIMAYDLKLYTASSPYVGHHSPLYPKDDESEEDRKLTVSAAVEFYIENGAPPRKLTLGVGAYGKTYTLKNPTDNFYAEAAGPGPPQVGSGLISEQESTIFYSEICHRAKDFKYYFDKDYFIPYAKSGNFWIGYDDEDSIAEKVDYAYRKELGGMMIWSIDQDDFKNLCGGWYSFAIAGTVKQRMDYHNKKNSKKSQLTKYGWLNR